jgi:ribosomal protein S14
MSDTDSECCKVKENLELEQSSTTTSSFVNVRRCKVCGRRHFGMTLKPVELGMKLANK